MAQIKDTSTPIRSLLFNLQSDGFTILSVYDGASLERIPQHKSLQSQRKIAAEIIGSVDCSVLIITDGKNRASLHLYLGNNPDEIVSDYVAPSSIHDHLDASIDAFCSIWEAKKWPLINETLA